MTICSVTAMTAQKPYYLPGDGVYIVGIPANLSTTFDSPVLVTQAYQAKFKTFNADLAAATETKSYNLGKYFNEDNSELNIIPFMGIGAVKNLVVRNFDGEPYTIGDNAPSKTWNDTYLVAGFAPWGGDDFYTLGVYDHWDCPLVYTADGMLSTGDIDAVTIDFGNPHEGLVCIGYNFNVVSPDADKASKIAENLKARLRIYDDAKTSTTAVYDHVVKSYEVSTVAANEDGLNIYAVEVYFDTPLIIDTPFDITINGFSAVGNAWVPQAVDTHGIYPTHTAYAKSSGETTVVSTADAAVNIVGYFNYIGTWGWYDGKNERGEVVGQGDYVQVYYDPSDADWPGDFFMGEPSFPIESTFGAENITIEDRSEWITTVELDKSQWEEHGALLVIMQASALPQGTTGRIGKLVLITKDNASRYTITVRQGSAMFSDDTDGINAPEITIPAEGGQVSVPFSGLMGIDGKRLTTLPEHGMYINNGRKYIK